MGDESPKSKPFELCASEVVLYNEDWGNMKLGLKIKSTIAAMALAATALVPAPANALLAVPKVAWPVCDTTRVTYCVESIAILPLGTNSAEQLTWVPSGTTASGSASVSATVPIVITNPGAAVTGMWTSSTWDASGKSAFGYDGVTIDIKTANAFVNHLFFTVQPVKYDPATGATKKAMSSTYANALADLNLDDQIIVKVRTGDIITGVSVGFTNNLSVTSAAGSITFAGTPVPIPQVTNASQCTGETGVASAVVSSMQGFVVVENDDMGFGVDGLSGRMSVASNGQCGTSTPVWDDQSKELKWTVAAPHFSPDGVTVNKGFYKAVIPANDALLLWGLSNPKDAVSALTISVTEETGGPAVSVKKISYIKGNIVIDVSGFEYSKPTLKIKKNSKYKKFAKPATFKCYDAKTKKTKTYSKVYGCPAGTTKR